jgi:small-conductance mechanosensitive channel
MEERTKDLIGGLLRAASDLKNPLVLGEFGVIAASLALAFLGAYLLRPRIRQAHVGGELGRGGLNRITFPLLALLLVFAGREIFYKRADTPLLDITLPLLMSLAIIRLAVYMLNHVFGQNARLRSLEKSIGYTVWIGVALYITGVLPRLAEVLDAVSVTAGKQKISLLLVIQAFVTIAITVVVALWLARVVETRLTRAEHMDSSLRVMLGKVVRTVLLVVAISVALPAVGIDITVLSVFGGALGVGLGFGLQKIASNYVSGFIILAERAIRLGDLVTADNKHGVVTQLNTRYTVLKSADGTESIIPNDTLITTTVVNHSQSDRRSAVHLPIHITHESDVSKALEILINTPRGNPLALAEPAPGAFVKDVNDASIELELVVWGVGPDPNHPALRSELYQTIWRAFQANGIKVPDQRREMLSFNKALQLER